MTRWPDHIQASRREYDAVDISVVMPCLNEQGSVGLCVKEAWEGIRKTGLRGEVIVADNGSTDQSVQVAEACGARVVHQPLRGYGNAYLKGFGAARGRIIVMGDSDCSYDFTALLSLVRPLSDGMDCVIGSRFLGDIRRGAMTWSHRYIGNPALTAILNTFFGLKVTDAHSGFRAFTRQGLDAMSLHCEGMEFASEIVVQAARAGLRMTEVPITYDRRVGESKLKAFRDGWRHLRFLLLLSPRHLFVAPGVTCLAAGLLSQLALAGLGGSAPVLAGKILAALVTVAGSQLAMFGTLASYYATDHSAAAPDKLTAWVGRRFTLERGLACGAALAAAGLAVVIRQSVLGWGPVSAGGGTASVAIGGLLCATLGGGLCSGAFLLAMFRFKRPGPVRLSPGGTEPVGTGPVGTGPAAMAAANIFPAAAAAVPEPAAAFGGNLLTAAAAVLTAPGGPAGPGR